MALSASTTVRAAAAKAPVFSSAPRQGQAFLGHLQCKAEGLAGSGLHVQRPFARGDVVFKETPSAFMQSRWSRQHTQACVSCGVLVGGGLRSLLKKAFAGCPPGCVHEQPSWAVLEKSGLFEDPSLSLPSAVPSPAKGSGAVFCSEACRDAQTQRGHHRVLAVDATDAQISAWDPFSAYAEKTIDTIELAGIVTAQAIADVLHGGSSPDAAMARHTQYVSVPWPDLVPDDAPGRQALVDRRWQVIRESHSLLSVTLPSVPAGLEELTSLEGLAKLVGLLELNTKDLRRENPLNARLQAALQGHSREVRAEIGKISLAWMRSRNASRRIPEFLNWASDDKDEDEALIEGAVLGETVLPVLPNFEGFGILPVFSLMNHSCSPNVQAKVSEVNVDVTVKAAEDIPVNGALYLSYLGYNPSPSRTARQQELHTRFAFRCQCSRCQKEAATQAA